MEQGETDMNFRVTKRIEMSLDFVADIEARSKTAALRIARTGRVAWREGRRLPLGGGRYMIEAGNDDLHSAFQRLSAYRAFRRELARLERASQKSGRKPRRFAA